MKNNAPSQLLSLGWRAGLVPGGAEIPDSRLVEIVEGPGALKPGRALDLGCGKGRNAIYLAQQGWDVVAIDLAEYAVETARRRADDAGVSVRFIHGDVTKLSTFGIGTGFSLVVDVGCYQALPADAQADHIVAMTNVTAPDAVLLMLGIMRIPGKPSLTPDDLQRRFGGWRLVEATPVGTKELNTYNRGVGARVLSAAMSRFEAQRYELRRNAEN
jgi:SAM-dependent methyltransferase